MKKILAGLFGVLVVMGGANAAGSINSIKAATTNTVRNSVYNINYGASGTTDGRGYRLGVTPQTNELNTARGASDIATTNVTVGNLASVTNSSGVASTGTNGAGVGIRVHRQKQLRRIRRILRYWIVINWWCRAVGAVV